MIIEPEGLVRSPRLFVPYLLGSFCLASGAFGGCAKGDVGELVLPTGGTGGGAPLVTGGDATGGDATGGEPTSGGTVVDPTGGSGAEGGAVSPCPPGEYLCAGECANLQSSRQHCGACGVRCTGDQICDAGTCVCPYVECSGTCVNTAVSVVHCGTCNNLCAIGEACVDGACTCQDESLTRCGALCVDLTTNPANCGACGNACEEPQVCTQGTCSDDCLPPESRCDQPDGSVRCANLQVSIDNCGACGIECAVGYACVDGICECAPGTELCGTLCVDTLTSLAHCGGCDRNCIHVCEAGVCVCEGGLIACGDECVDTATSALHCGACDQPCGTGSSCVEGACVCDAGLDPCPVAEGEGTSCTDLQADDLNCGACGTSCGEEASCVAAVCTCDEAGLTFCSGECADLDYSPSHCGACGDPCDDGQICQEGQCQTPALVVRSKTPDGPNDLETETAPTIRLCNQSSNSVSLNGITISYWYTKDGTTTNQIPTFPWPQIPATNSVTRLDPPLTDADFVLTMAITGSPSLAGSECVEFQQSVHGGEGWTQGYKIDNDWSYLEGEFAVNERITVYQNGNLIWGTEPPPRAE